MPAWNYIWIDDEIDGNLPHLALHGVTPEEFCQVVESPVRGPEPSRTEPDYTVVWGWTRSNRYLMAVYLQIDAVTLMPVTAYEQTPKD